MLGSFLMQAGRLDDALKVYNAISESEPEDPRAYFGIADIFKQRGDIARAAQARRKAYELEADTDGARLFAAALTEKDYEKADVTLARAQLEEQRQAAKQRYVSPLDLARLHAMVGDREAAFAALEQAMADPPVGLTLLKVDPAWNSIRTDPRFAAIVRRVGIP